MRLDAMQRHGSRAEWLGARRIGSSDVAAILGVSAYSGPWDVWERLRADQVDDAPPTPAMLRGIRLEPRILRRYSAETGRDARRPPSHVLWTRDRWASASPDALVVQDDLVVEAKTDRDPRRWGEPCEIARWDPAAAEVVRPDYYLQVAHQMWVLDAAAADLAVLLPGQDPFVPELRIYRLQRDRELEAALVARLEAWWDRHIVGGEPPALDGSKAAGRHLAKRGGAGAVPATPEQVALAAAYETARIQEQDWGRAKWQAGQLLAASAGDADRLDLPRGRVTLVRHSGRSYLDERRLLEDHPELAETLARYRRTASAHVFPRISGVDLA